MTYISQRQFLVECSHEDIEGYFMQKSGGNKSADSNKIYGGGSSTPAIITGIADVENVTIGRAFDATRDTAMLKTIRDQVGVLVTDIIVAEVDADLKPVAGGTITYSDRVLVGISEPEYESSSGDAAAVQLEFAVTSVATGA